MIFSRRRAIQAFSAAGIAPLLSTDADAAQIPAPPPEGKDTPKIAVLTGDTGIGGRGGTTQPSSSGLNPIDPASGPHRIRQLGVANVCGGGPGALPWTEESLIATMKPWKDAGITVGNLMINVSNNIIYNRPGRDEDIEKIKASLTAAGKVGLPVVEYNFYAHRAVEGYFEEIDSSRADTAWTGFDYDGVMKAGQRFPVRAEEIGMKFRDLPPLPGEGPHKLDEIWANITYYLKAVVPTAEKANVRMALHPNDPPAPISRGSEQIMGSVEGWKRLIAIVNSPSNGITFDCGVTREMGGDPIEVAHYFGSRDRINHVHFRNVKVVKPYERYSEVWIDEGDNNMFAVMRELVRNKYRFQIYPEHPRRLDYDADRTSFNTQYPGGGGYTAIAYNVGYARAMLQAVMSTI